MSDFLSLFEPVTIPDGCSPEFPLDFVQQALGPETVAAVTQPDGTPSVVIGGDCVVIPWKTYRGRSQQEVMEQLARAARDLVLHVAHRSRVLTVGLSVLCMFYRRVNGNFYPMTDILVTADGFDAVAPVATPSLKLHAVSREDWDAERRMIGVRQAGNFVMTMRAGEPLSYSPDAREWSLEAGLAILDANRVVLGEV